jgi:hypothetical protein
VSSRTIANRVFQAPNQYIKFPREFKQLDAALATNFPVQRIAVGPPPAKLELMVLEPGDYDAKPSSTITPHHPQSRNDQNRYDFDVTSLFRAT